MHLLVVPFQYVKLKDLGTNVTNHLKTKPICGVVLTKVACTMPLIECGSCFHIIFFYLCPLYGC